MSLWNPVGEGAKAGPHIDILSRAPESLVTPLARTQAVVGLDWRIVAIRIGHIF
jgi:hypothetical protein